ncbi:hypothetical protein C1H46_000195 [Malus baccata]|uniref:Uncharacterized protein n=1 Tax=Malus baccata TaxID=106549 RepID=A0A540NTB3_MALBA|nr:hypothetical protein C1H46_000195 [Malus baccata]
MKRVGLLPLGTLPHFTATHSSSHLLFFSFLSNPMSLLSQTPFFSALSRKAKKSFNPSQFGIPLPANLPGFIFYFFIYMSVLSRFKHLFTAAPRKMKNIAPSHP